MDDIELHDFRKGNRLPEDRDDDNNLEWGHVVRRRLERRKLIRI